MPVICETAKLNHKNSPPAPPLTFANYNHGEGFFLKDNAINKEFDKKSPANILENINQVLHNRNGTE